jgi:serine/threonine protein kinase
MGEVYRGRDTRLGRDVAIKVLPSHHATEHMRQRLHREARAISRIAHPHICTLFDVGNEGGVDYLVMEYLEGQTLSDLLHRGPLDSEQLAHWGADIAEALAEAHRQGVLHRDLKPGNIMVTRSGVKVLDFGLAAFTQDARTEVTDGATEEMPLTEAGAVVGTLQYMSPEQLATGKATARSDIFALGTILYEMGTGRRAFGETTRAAIMTAILDREPASMSSLQPLTPPALEQVVRRCMAKAPDDRFQNARDLAFALRQLASPSAPAAPRPPRRRMWVAAAAIAAVVIAIVASVLTMRRSAFPSGNAVPTLAVLPFQNLGLESRQDYLLLAVADEVTTILSANPSLTVRPFSISRSLRADIDPRKAGNDLKVAAIVTGNLRTQGDRLFVTLEAIDARENKLLWRDTFDSQSADLLEMRRELSGRITGGLISRLVPSAPASGGNAASGSSGPRNQQAYALFLHASALPNDPQPNEEALKILEEAVRLDPTYAPAWTAISARAYFSYTYNGAGESAFRRAHEAARRALELDPNMDEAASRLITLRAEAGETVQAWHDATALVRRRPQSSRARVALSYALRYGGALEESARQCETAWQLDAHAGLRSCALTFLMQQDLDRARDFIDLDSGSSWAQNSMAGLHLRQGNVGEAKRIFAESGFRTARAIMTAPESELDAAVAQAHSLRDGEPLYNMGIYTAARNRPDLAIGLLTEAARRNFCGYPAVDHEPLLASARRHPAWPAYHESAVACHQAFLRGIGR